jgi:hypothetical protein
MLREIRASGLRPGDVYSGTAQDGSAWVTVDSVRRVCVGEDAYVDVTDPAGWTIEFSPAETVFIEERGERWMR